MFQLKTSTVAAAKRFVSFPQNIELGDFPATVLRQFLRGAVGQLYCGLVTTLAVNQAPDPAYCGFVGREFTRD